MQVFKTYFKIFKKQWVSIIVYVFLFIGVTMTFTASLLKENDKQFSAEKVPILVINKDNESDLVQGLLNYLGRKADFVQVADNEMARKDALFYQKIVYILTIPEGFTDSFIKGGNVNLVKQTIPDATASYSVDTAVDNYLNTARIYVKQFPGISQKELVSYVDDTLKENTQVTLNNLKGNEKNRSANFNMNYFNYLAYIIIAVFIIGLSNVMGSFQRIDIRRKHQASPLSSQKINMQLILASFIFVMGYLAVFLTANLVCNPYNSLDETTAMYWLNAFVFSLVALSISYLIGITVKGKKAISAISTALSLSLSFISGVFVPQEYLGNAVLKAASFTPSYWYVRANNAIEKLNVYNWDNLSHIFGFMAIEIGFAAAILSIALVVSKRRSQQAY